MRLIIEQDAHAGSVWAAKYIVSRIKAKAEVTDQPFVLGLPTGGTPIGTYKELIKMYQAGEVSFENVAAGKVVSVESTKEINGMKKIKGENMVKIAQMDNSIHYVSGVN